MTEQLLQSEQTNKANLDESFNWSMHYHLQSQVLDLHKRFEGELEDLKGARLKVELESLKDSDGLSETERGLYRRVEMILENAIHCLGDMTSYKDINATLEKIGSTGLPEETSDLMIIATVLNRHSPSLDEQKRRKKGYKALIAEAWNSKAFKQELRERSLDISAVSNKMKEAIFILVNRRSKGGVTKSTLE